MLSCRGLSLGLWYLDSRLPLPLIPLFCPELSIVDSFPWILLFLSLPSTTSNFSLLYCLLHVLARMYWSLFRLPLSHYDIGRSLSAALHLAYIEKKAHVQLTR